MKKIIELDLRSELPRAGQQTRDELRFVDWLWYDHDMWDFVFSNYSQPHRHYHSMDHLRYLVVKARQFGYDRPTTKLNTWPTMTAMIVFHDIVYDPLAKGGKNEIESAVLARLRLEDYPGLDVDKAVRGIEATITHQSDDVFIQDFLDLDMGILASDPRDYNVYARKVRKEYAVFELDQYIEGRMKFLTSQLERSNIFFHETREVQTWEINRWAGRRAEFTTERAHNNLAMEMGYLSNDPKKYFEE